MFCFIYPVTQDSREESITSLSTLGNSVDPLYLVGVGILARPSFTRAVECELNENQFASRHSLDGKFLFIDPKYVMMLYMYIVAASFTLFLLFFLPLFEFLFLCEISLAKNVEASNSNDFGSLFIVFRHWHSNKSL